MICKSNSDDAIVKTFVDKFLSDGYIDYPEISRFIDSIPQEEQNKEIVEKLFKLILGYIEGSRIFPDDIQYLSFEQLTFHGLYSLEYDFYKAIIESNESFDLPAWVYFGTGVCLYNLKQYEEAKRFFILAKDDDEDYADEARDYLSKIEGMTQI